jgi:hypothetical protein
MFCRQAQTACANSRRPAWRCGELASRAAPVTRRHLSSAVAVSVSSAPRHRRPRRRGQQPEQHGLPFQGQSRHGDARNYAVARSSQQQQRSPSEKAPRVAVIGAGLSGLTAAYYLARKLPPESSIVIFEASDRVGGWLRSEKHSVRLNDVSANVLLERGPRMLSTARNFARNDRLVLFDLVWICGIMHTP